MKNQARKSGGKPTSQSFLARWGLLDLVSSVMNGLQAAERITQALFSVMFDSIEVSRNLAQYNKMEVAE